MPSNNIVSSVGPSKSPPQLGVLIIGSKGSIATTLMAAKCVAANGVDLNFQLPSQQEPAFNGMGLLELKEMVFGGWDVVPESYSQSCRLHNVVPKHLVPEIATELDKTDIYPAVMAQSDATIENLLRNEKSQSSERHKDIEYTPNVFTKRPLLELVKSVQMDISDFKKKHGLSRVIVVNLASTDKLIEMKPEHQTLAAFEAALEKSLPTISSFMIYAYAAMKSGCNLVNFTPTTSFEIPALLELANNNNCALAGKDGKTGQTLYKTVIAPMIKYRGLKLTGWYSTNILGNRDGEVLKDPTHRETKINTKKGVLKSIMGYEDFDHQVHIHYYPPRGDSKEAWDNVDFRGWFDVDMQMKINWLGDDSILAAPLVVDLIRWVDFFSLKGEKGILNQLASYFKEPLGTEEHDFFKQTDMLRQHVRARYAHSGK